MLNISPPSKEDFPIKNLVFDLGGVLYEIDLNRSLKKFQALMPAAQQEEWKHRNLLLVSELVQELETDRMSSDDFLKAMKSQYQFDCSLAELKDAWMAILTGIIPGRIDMLKALKGKYRLFLLSNTNRIHFERLESECAEMFSLFEKCYYSFEMRMHKPDREIYDQVVKENQLNPAECLFIDDAPANIEGAKIAGWQARLHSENDHLLTQELTSILPRL